MPVKSQIAKTLHIMLLGLSIAIGFALAASSSLLQTAQAAGPGLSVTKTAPATVTAGTNPYIHNYR